MSEESDTQIIAKVSSSGESMPFGISIRAWLAGMMVYTCCMLVLLKMPIPEAFNAMTMSAIIFYFKDSKAPTPSK